MRSLFVLTAVTVLGVTAAPAPAQQTTGPAVEIRLKSVNDLRVFGTFEGHAASSQINLEGLQFAVGLSPRGYLYTERPAYRAGMPANPPPFVTSGPNPAAGVGNSVATGAYRRPEVPGC